MDQKLKDRDFDYATLILRVTLGLFFVIAGLAQLAHWAGFVDTVTGFAIVSQGDFTGSVSAFVSWSELVLGLLLIFGLATPLVSIVVALLSFIFAAVNGFVSGTSLSKEILFIAVALALVLFGAGRFSLDNKVRAKTN